MRLKSLGLRPFKTVFWQAYGNLNNCLVDADVQLRLWPSTSYQNLRYSMFPLSLTAVLTEVQREHFF